MMVQSDKKRIWSAKEEMQPRIKGSKFHSFDTLWYFSYILSYNYWLRWFLNHFKTKRHIYIWYEDIEIQFSRLPCQKVEIQKCNSVVKNWNRVLTNQGYVGHISVYRAPNGMSWGIEKLTQMATIFMSCTRVSSPSIIEKIVVEVHRIEYTTNQYTSWSRVLSSVFCNLLINLPCFHTTFPTQF